MNPMITNARLGRVRRLPEASGNEMLLVVPEVATLLRTSPKAVYEMMRRGQLPGVLRIGRRRLVRRDVLLDWLHHKCAPSDRSDR